MHARRCVVLARVQHGRLLDPPALRIEGLHAVQWPHVILPARYDQLRAQHAARGGVACLSQLGPLPPRVGADVTAPCPSKHLHMQGRDKVDSHANTARITRRTSSVGAVRPAHTGEAL